MLSFDFDQKSETEDPFTSASLLKRRKRAGARQVDAMDVSQHLTGGTMTRALRQLGVVLRLPPGREIPVSGREKEEQVLSAQAPRTRTTFTA